MRRLPAAEVERAVIDQLRAMLRSPELIVRTLSEASKHDSTVDENEVREALQQLDMLWDELFPAEQARIVRLLVERIDVDEGSLAIKLRTNGLGAVAADLQNAGRQQTQWGRAA